MRDMPNLLDPTLAKTLIKDQAKLAQTALPILTVSASYKEDIKGFYGYPEDDDLPDIVFSRAHYSMALAIAISAWGSQSDLAGFSPTKKSKIDPKKAWIADPTNYVSEADWNKIRLTELVGKVLARKPLLHQLKEFVDKFGRKKLPILSSIEQPLMMLAQDIDSPILSLHIAVGNFLAPMGKTVVQVITDPHVRPEYLDYAHLKNLHYCVFDQATKTDVLELAAFRGKALSEDRVVVTGPPVDPRIVAMRAKKTAWRSGKLKLCLTTGGLGTNKTELLLILEQLLPVLRARKNELDLSLLIYAGTHFDIKQAVINLAKKHRVAISNLDDRSAKLRVIYHPQIIDANELLVQHGFNWADGFITKPSGDMAYEAAAAGCFILTLKEWGEWEHNIRARFETLGIARKAQVDQIVGQLTALTSSGGKSGSFIESAMNSALKLDPLYLRGASQIIKAYVGVKKDLKNTGS